MKTKRTFLSILTLCIALLFTACSGKEAASTKSTDTKTESGSESADDSNSKLDDLYQQENQIFADHEDVWNKAFPLEHTFSVFLFLVSRFCENSGDLFVTFFLGYTCKISVTHSCL